MVQINSSILIVDGYNIIGAWENLKDLKNKDMGSARDQLIHTLSAYLSWSWQRIIVVFDGQEFQWEEHDGVEVVYTGMRETADTLIERLAAGLVSYGRVEVATSDFAEYRAAAAVGAGVLSATALKERLAEQRAAYMRHTAPAEKKGLMLNEVLNEDILRTLDRLRRS